MAALCSGPTSPALTPATTAMNRARSASDSRTISTLSAANAAEYSASPPGVASTPIRVAPLALAAFAVSATMSTKGRPADRIAAAWAWAVLHGMARTSAPAAFSRSAISPRVRPAASG
ncbi:hypothetical protein D3C72_985680 [compost metagenome]